MGGRVQMATGDVERTHGRSPGALGCRARTVKVNRLCVQRYCLVQLLVLFWSCLMSSVGASLPVQELLPSVLFS